MRIFDSIAAAATKYGRRLDDAVETAGDLMRALQSQSASEIARRLSDSIHPESIIPQTEAELIPEFSWTLESLQSALVAMSIGDMQPAQRLMFAMMRDPVIAHGVETRAETLIQVPVHFEKHPDCPQWFFDCWVDTWPEILKPSVRQQLAEYRTMLGVGISNVIYAPDRSGRAWMPSNRLLEPANLMWNADPHDRRYYFNAVDCGRQPVYDTGERFLLWKRAGRRPHLAGAELPLAVAWFTKQEALRAWPSHNRSHGKPQRVLKVPADQRESADVRALVAQAQALLAGGVMILPQYRDQLPNFDFDLVEAHTQAYETFERLIQLCDNYITLVLLGATENTQGNSASNSKAMTHDRVTMRKVKADCRSDEESVNQLARYTAFLNKLPPHVAPRLVCEADPPEDQNQAAERSERKSKAGDAMGSLIQKLDAHNAANQDNKIAYEPDYLLEQVGLLLTRKQDGQQSRKM